MDKDQLIPGMIVKITFGKGAYGPKGKWSSLIWVYAVTRSDERVTGIQYKPFATRGGEFHPAGYYEFTRPQNTERISIHFDQWWETFNAKILV